ncbi:MAG: mechanosensitive ion channel family protein, partial [Xenococcus sp. (in: cyanobacteria)]
PQLMVKTYSELYENIQDKCNEVGIEIMSPHYHALRDGNQNTIPEDYLPKDYDKPGFRVNRVQEQFNQLDKPSPPHSPK